MGEAMAGAVKRTRNRAETETRLLEAVERLLVRGGFGAITPSAVGREAGTDKMLIYRYYGGLDGLMHAVVDRPGFFPGLEDLCAGEREGLRALPAPERGRLVLQRFVEALARSPVALELMAWEIVERNALTAVAEEARERLGLQIITELFGDEDKATMAAVTALLASALTYLLLRRRKITTFDGLDLHSQASWDLFLDTAARMIEGVLAQPHDPDLLGVMHGKAVRIENN